MSTPVAVTTTRIARVGTPVLVNPVAPSTVPTGLSKRQTVQLNMTRVPTVPGIDHLEPQKVQELLRNQQCILVDLRSDDRASGLIDGSTHIPAIAKVPFLTRVPELVQQWAKEKLVVFTCQYSAHRAPQCANWYRELAPASQQVGILSGGFRGWEASGLPVARALTDKDGLLDAKALDVKALQLGQHFVQAAKHCRLQASN